MTIWPERPTCHDRDAVAARSLSGEQVAWRKRNGIRRCSYCGSVHPEELVKHILAGGAVGGSDWKYGWPHKFYLHRTTAGGVDAKWYNAHLLDLGPDAYSKVAYLLGAVSGISFSFDEESRLMYSAPYAGYQAFSTTLDEESRRIYEEEE